MDGCIVVIEKEKIIIIHKKEYEFDRWLGQRRMVKLKSVDCVCRLVLSVI
jgi:hypothetical protein